MDVNLTHSDLDHIIIKEDESSIRLDKLLSTHYSHLSRTYFQWLIQEGCVLVNGQRVKKREKLKARDEIEVQLVCTDALSLEPEEIPLDILYEDDHLLAVNKPAGMVVHPGAGNWTGTFVNALLFYCRTLPRHDTIRPGIVHRLDKDTSGVLVAAKTLQMHKALSDLFSSRQMQKSYLAICLGTPPQEMLIDAPLGRHPNKRVLMAVIPEGREARTHIRTRTSNGELSLLEVDLLTGRTHQIRVHLKHIGHPILGDALYGREPVNARYQASRQMLHSHSLSFIHPVTGERLSLHAPVPQDMRSFIEV